MALSPRETYFNCIHDLMRKVWMEHAVWTRAAIISIADGLPDEEQVTNRLLRNPADIAAIFRPLYGNAVAEQLNTLITDHLVIAAQLVKQAKAGDTAAAAITEQRWYANADAIAVFLSSINPFWSKETMQQMWHEHLALVKSQAVARLNKDYGSEIAAFDEGENLILKMADELTEGIARQFPPCCFKTR